MSAASAGARAALLSAFVLVTAGCVGTVESRMPSPTAAHAGTDRAAIAARLSEVGAAMVAGDPEACAAVFRPDAVYLANGRSALHGRAAIVDHYRARLATTIYRSIALTPSEVRRVGDTLYEWGTSIAVTVPRATPNAAPTRSGGQYLTIWVLGDDGRWYIQWDAPMARELTAEELAPG